MSTEYDIGFKKALSKMFGQLTRLAPVDEVGGLVAAENCIAKVCCPSARTSLKDGYAVVSADLENASEDRPAKLRVCGRSVAGCNTDVTVESGTAVKIMTGARIPGGANTVIANEFTREKDGWVLCHRDAGPGRNIIEQGHDVMKGKSIVSVGEVLTPAKTGLLAAGGISFVRVHPRPRIGIIAVGDEVVSPGKPLRPGQLYASNLVTLLSWLRHFQMEAEVAIVGDQTENLSRAAESMLENVDVLITSGGAWKSDRDLTIKVLKEMGDAVIDENGGQRSVSPLKMKSRLKSQANANALIKVPEGLEQLDQKNQIQVQVLSGNVYRNNAR